MVATQPDDDWHWADALLRFLGGDSCQVRKSMPQPVFFSSLAEEPVPVEALEVHGQGGISSAAWLLEELDISGMKSWRRSRVAECEETDRSACIMRVLQQAWRQSLSGALDSELKEFVESRRDQALALAAEDEPAVTLSDKADRIIKAIISSSDYELLPTDWLRLSHMFEVDFVLHCLPGAELRYCERCSSFGHVHTGKQPLASLHVAWRGSESLRSLGEPEADRCSDAVGKWEPLGLGPARHSTCLSLPVQLSEESTSHGFEEAESLAEEAVAKTLFNMRVFGTKPQDIEQAETCPKHWSFLSRNCSTSSTACCEACSDPSPGSPEKPCCSQTCCIRDYGDTGDAISTAASEVLSGGSSGSRDPAGARFCVLLDGAFDLLSPGFCASPTLKATINREIFHRVFVEAIAASGNVAPNRVRVLGIGPPLEALRETARMEKALICYGSEDSSGQGVAKDPVDTGAGVLPFLMLDEARLAGGPGSVRILALLRESDEDEQMSALEALEQVARDLDVADSQLQRALTPWSGGQHARLWLHPGVCPRPVRARRQRGFDFRHCF